MKVPFPPGNLQGLQIKKVKPELRRNLSRKTKTCDIKFQTLQNNVLKYFCISTNFASNICSQGDKDELKPNSAFKKKTAISNV